MGLGAAIGGVLGGAIAGAATGGTATQAGAMAGSAIGQGVEGMVGRKKGMAMIPPAEYAMDRKFLNILQRRRRAIETGAAGSSDRAAMLQAMKTFGTQSFNAGGPVNTGFLSQLMSQYQSNLNSNLGQQYAQTLGLEYQQRKDMTDQRISNAMTRFDNTMAPAAQKEKSSGMNLMAILNSGMLGGQENALGLSPTAGE